MAGCTTFTVLLHDKFLRPTAGDEKIKDLKPRRSRERAHLRSIEWTLRVRRYDEVAAVHEGKATGVERGQPSSLKGMAAPPAWPR